MWQYEKKLQYPVRIKNTNPALAKVIISQLGGPDGELGATMRYLSKRYSAPCREVQAILSDIGASLHPRRKSCPQHEPQAAGFYPISEIYPLMIFTQVSKSRRLVSRQML